MHVHYVWLQFSYRGTNGDKGGNDVQRIGAITEMQVMHLHVTLFRKRGGISFGERNSRDEVVLHNLCCGEHHHTSGGSLWSGGSGEVCYVMKDTQCRCQD